MESLISRSPLLQFIYRPLDGSGAVAVSNAVSGQDLSMRGDSRLISILPDRDSLQTINNNNSLANANVNANSGLRMSHTAVQAVTDKYMIKRSDRDSSRNSNGDRAAWRSAVPVPRPTSGTGAAHTGITAGIANTNTSASAGASAGAAAGIQGSFSPIERNDRSNALHSHSSNFSGSPLRPRAPALARPGPRSGSGRGTSTVIHADSDFPEPLRPSRLLASAYGQNYDHSPSRMSTSFVDDDYSAYGL